MSGARTLIKGPKKIFENFRENSEIWEIGRSKIPDWGRAGRGASPRPAVSALADEGVEAVGISSTASNHARNY